MHSSDTTTHPQAAEPKLTWQEPALIDLDVASTEYTPDPFDPAGPMAS
jgi:hypothetical protein